MALNILALILVVLFVWGALWLTTRLSNKKRKQNELKDGDFEALLNSAGNQPICLECKGAGAKTKMGDIYTCPICEGTGVISSASLDS